MTAATGDPSPWPAADIRISTLPYELLARVIFHARARVIIARCAAEGGRLAIASAKTVAAVERLAKADRRHAATVDQWDADPSVATLIELLAAVPTPEPMIALCCQVWPLGHRRRATAYAIHRNQPPPRGILGKLIR